MASSSSKTSAASLALFLLLNLVLFTLTTACGTCPTPTPPNPNPPSPTKPKPPPSSPPSGGGGGGKCPIDALKLAVCANVLNGLINVTLGKPPKAPCCPLLSGLVDLEAAVCLCTAIKANVLGLHLNIPVDLSLLLNYCGKHVPSGFQCP